jgi:Ran GTPase-activating protein 1
LKEFTAGRNRLEDAGAKAMSAAFRHLGTLERIELPQNGIRVEGIGELAKCVGTSSNLKTLNLNDNTFTTVGARVMARAIRNIESCLEVVDFGDCLCRVGAIDIIEALVDNHSETIQVMCE